MATTGTTGWMTPTELMQETGLSRSTVYLGIKEGTLPVKAYRFGKRILFSRREWETLQGIASPVAAPQAPTQPTATGDVA